MNLHSEIRLLTLTGPSVALLLAFTFFLLWRYKINDSYLLHLVSALALFAVAMFMQILHIPADYGINALMTALMYCLAMILFCQGILVRIGKNTPYKLQTFLSIVIVIGLYYFYYMDKNLVARIYILNFGCGLILMCALPAAHVLKQGKSINKVLFWSFVVFSLSFFVRTTFSMNFPTGMPPAEKFNSSLFWMILQISLLLFTVYLSVILIIVALHDRIEELHKEKDEDVLTKLLNRRGFFSNLEKQFKQYPTKRRFLLLADIDNFKRINDTYGHHAGDTVLKQFAIAVRNCLFDEDVIGRIGGEEFAIVINSSNNGQKAIELAFRLQKAVNSTTYDTVANDLHVTASFGLVAVNESIEAAFLKADNLLYKAKNSGRNQIVTSPDLNPSVN